MHRAFFALTGLVVCSTGPLSVQSALAQGAVGRGSPSAMTPQTQTPQTHLGSPTGLPIAIPGVTQGAGSNGASTQRAAILPKDSASIFDRWGNLFVEQGSVTPVLGASIVTSSGANSSATQIRTNERGFFPLGGGQKSGSPAEAPIVSINISLPSSPDLKGGAPSSVLVGLLLPAVQKAREAASMVQVAHIFAGNSGKASVTIRRNGEHATVDWGDGSAPTDVAREGRQVSAGTTEARGRIIFVGGTVKY